MNKLKICRFSKENIIHITYSSDEYDRKPVQINIFYNDLKDVIYNTHVFKKNEMVVHINQHEINTKID
jgi:hypothetical protein